MDDAFVREKLIAMATADQKMREKGIKDKSAWDGNLDKRHTKELKSILATYGWPTIPRVGVEASNDAWLIAQHADQDLAFQKECLSLLKSLPIGEVSPQNIAYLEDRVLVGEGKPQLYGTQFQGRGKAMKPQPIENEENIEQRRKAMGLNSMAEYQQQLLDIYD